MQAIRTGACTAFLTDVAAAASGEDSARILPMAFKTGRLRATPAPLRNVRRGIIQFFSISIFLGIKSVSKRETQRNLFDERGGAILVFLHGFKRAINHAFVELVEFAPESVAGHFAREMFHDLIFAAHEYLLQSFRPCKGFARGQSPGRVESKAPIGVAPAAKVIKILET